MRKLLDGKAKAEEEASRSWKEECAKANLTLEVTAAELAKVKGKMKESVNAMEVYKQSCWGFAKGSPHGPCPPRIKAKGSRIEMWM
jgi:hypothetical protein